MHAWRGPGEQLPTLQPFIGVLGSAGSWYCILPSNSEYKLQSAFALLPAPDLRRCGGGGMLSTLVAIASGRRAVCTKESIHRGLTVTGAECDSHLEAHTMHQTRCVPCQDILPLLLGWQLSNGMPAAASQSHRRCRPLSAAARCCGQAVHAHASIVLRLPGTSSDLCCEELVRDTNWNRAWQPLRYRCAAGLPT